MPTGQGALSPWIAPALAFVAGFADASTFVGADGIFCAHVTGNFVVLAADLAHGASVDEWLKLATFPVFVATVFISSAVHRRVAPGAWAERGLLLAQAALLAVAALAGSLYDTRVPGATRSAVVILLVMAMAIQNAIHRLDTGLGPMTTVMTGNVTQYVAEWTAPAKSDEVRARRRKLLRVILLFALGCAAGALGVSRVGFLTLLVPIGVVLGAARWRTNAQAP